LSTKVDPLQNGIIFGANHFDMLGNRPWESWIKEYAEGHQNPINRLTHTVGIPSIVVSIPLFLISIAAPRCLPWAVGLFVGGWILQFIGHAFEGKAPEFFKDWRFLLVGTRWWWAKIRGKA
jgi:uncharacterized membrane protein YGL010W